MKKILAISGSTRASSSNDSILKFIAKTYEEKLEIVIFDGIDKLPHFNPDLDNDTTLPLPVRNLRKQIEAADGIIICTPEYVFSLPGSLKNAIEWHVSTTLLSNKPIGFIVVAASGVKAFESLDLILTTLEGQMTTNTKLLINGAKGKIGKEGEISDLKIQDNIKSLVQSLIHLVGQDN